MRSLQDIKKDSRIQIQTVGMDGGQGWLTLHGKTFRVVWSNGGGWEHVSMSTSSRCPTWEEMCKAKDVFFYPYEICVEYHPAEKDYVNFHPYCLHIWRPVDGKFPKPPKIFV